MAFNGTERFEKQEIVDYLESIGSTFGADLNAQTSFDYTLYWLEIPTDDPEILETALQILSDWAYAVTLAPEEVELERGVIMEEWRGSQGFSSALSRQLVPTDIWFLAVHRPEPYRPAGGDRNRAGGAP